MTYTKRQQQIIDEISSGNQVVAFAENHKITGAYFDHYAPHKVHLASLKSLQQHGIIKRYKVERRPRHKYDLWYYCLAEDN